MLDMLQLIMTITLVSPILTVQHHHSNPNLKELSLLHQLMEMSLPYYTNKATDYNTDTNNYDLQLIPHTDSNSQAVLINDPAEISRHVYLEDYPNIGSGRLEAGLDAAAPGVEDEYLRSSRSYMMQGINKEEPYPLLTMARHNNFRKRSPQPNLSLSINQPMNMLRRKMLQTLAEQARQKNLRPDIMNTVGK